MIDPARLKKWLLVAAGVYLILPRDLVPDFVGRGLGYLEDLLLIGVGVWAYRRYRRLFAAGAGADAGRRSGPAQEPEQAEVPFEPHRVLGVAPSASRAEIDAAYRARMHEYHPDKVSHLGEDLQKLAHEKAVAIQRAYAALKR